MSYEIAGDEAWTHEDPADPTRYHRFLGGVFGPESDLERLETRLKRVAGAEGEIGWKKITLPTESLYCDFIDAFFDELETRELKYRHLFCDRSMIYVPQVGSTPPTRDAVQYKLLYQFIKHSFCLERLSLDDVVRVRLDQHSNTAETARLADFVKRLSVPPNVQVFYHRSSQFRRIQAVDLLIGAAGFHGNRKHLRREAAQRGMTKKQALRSRLATRVRDHLTRISNAERGAKAFNWFESTGPGVATRCDLRISIWKFMPARFQIDKGWQNDHLDKQGRYVAPAIDPTIHTPESLRTGTSTGGAVSSAAALAAALRNEG